jgi:LPS export ABC transporter protein LptC
MRFRWSLLLRPQGHKIALLSALVIPSGRPSIEIKGFRLVESKGQVRSFEMKAKTAKLYKPEDILALDTLEANIYGAEKDKVFKVSGDIGILDSTSQDFRIYQGSEVISPDGYRFKSDSILYQHANQLLTTEDDVEAEPVQKKSDGQFRVSGQGLKIDIAKGTYEIKKKARTNQKLSAGSNLQIRAQSAIFSPESDSATFLKNVSVRSPTIEMMGERLRIDFSSEEDPLSGQKNMTNPKRLTLESAQGMNGRRIQANVGKLRLLSKGLVVNLGADGGVLTSEAIGNVDGVTEEGVKLKAEKLVSDIFEGQERIILKDNVEILTDSRIANCQDAQFFPATGDIILEKVASVKTEDQVLEGDVIRFSTKNSNVIVEKARGSTKKSNFFGPKSPSEPPQSEKKD